MDDFKLLKQIFDRIEDGKDLSLTLSQFVKDYRHIGKDSSKPFYSSIREVTYSLVSICKSINIEYMDLALMYESLLSDQNLYEAFRNEEPLHTIFNYARYRNLHVNGFSYSNLHKGIYTDEDSGFKVKISDEISTVLEWQVLEIYMNMYGDPKKDARAIVLESWVRFFEVIDLFNNKPINFNLLILNDI